MAQRRSRALLRVLAVPLVGTLAMGLTLAQGAVTQVAGGAPRSQPADAQPVNTWPKGGHDAANTDASPDPLLSTADAAQLGVRWMAGTGTTEYSSPVVQWNAALGETLAYQGNENGYLTAYDEANGQTVWSAFLGSAIRDTPLVEGNNVWVADTFSPSLFKLNAATGAVECSTPLVSTDNGSPTIGLGPGGQLTVYIAVNDLGTANGPLYAVNEADCSVDWQYDSYNGNDAAGSWDFLSYADSATGEPLVVLGTADPDSAVYAVDAATGQKVWSFKTLPVSTTTDTDVGAGASITAPGVNGFADGVAYVPGKDGYLYALDLTTGAMIWDFNFGAAYPGGVPYSRSTPAVTGDDVIVGGTMGVVEVNATTGAPVWHWHGAAGTGGAGEVVGAVAVIGPPGQQVVAATNLSGDLDVLDAQTGALLYTDNIGYFSVASPADVDGNLLVSSSSGFLYDFAPGGANSGTPTTAVTSPAAGANVGNPNGMLTIKGTASGGPVAGVQVAVQEGGSAGPWWDGASGTFTTGYFNNPATLASPGSASTTWALAVPVPTSGGTYKVLASAVAQNGLADASADSPSPSAAHVSFTVGFLHSAPHFMTTNGSYVAPGAAVDVAGSGFGPGEQVGVTLDGTTLATVTASGTGTLATTAVAVPAATATGPAALVATGATTGDTSSASIDVSNEWTSQAGGPTHTAVDANDSVLAQHVSPSSGTYLTQAWSYPSGAAIETSATVCKNVAYFANDAGVVTALDIHQSIPLWTYQAPSAVDSSPLVAAGLVIFGTESGEVVALSQATGAVVWTDTVGSAVNSSPESANGLVVVGSAAGTLYALATATGAVTWSQPLGGPIQGSPAIDAGAGRVVVGAGDSVVGLRLSTGAVAWTQATAGAVTAYPTLVAGKVLVGSADGVVHQYSESSGTPGWSFTANGAVTAGGSLWSGTTDYIVGSAAGTVYFLNTQNGSVARSYTTGSAVVGVSAAPGFAVVTSAAGVTQGFKYLGYASWKYTATAGFNSSATVVNGILYLTGLDQTIRAFTIPGRPIP